MNEKIYYNEDLPEGVEPLYNGNIADVYYSAHDSAHFRLSYDGLNRLTEAQQYTRDGVKTVLRPRLLLTIKWGISLLSNCHLLKMRNISDTNSE